MYLTLFFVCDLVRCHILGEWYLKRCVSYAVFTYSNIERQLYYIRSSSNLQDLIRSQRTSKECAGDIEMRHHCDLK